MRPHFGAWLCLFPGQPSCIGRRICESERAGSDGARIPVRFWEVGNRISLILLKAKPKKDQSDDEADRDDPPNPMYALWNEFLFPAEFLLDKLVVIKFIVRKIKAADVGFVRPAGVFVRATFRAGPGVSWQISSAVGT